VHVIAVYIKELTCASAGLTHLQTVLLAVSEESDPADPLRSLNLKL